MLTFMNNLPLETSVKSFIRVKYGLVKFFLFVLRSHSLQITLPALERTSQAPCLRFVLVFVLLFVWILFYYYYYYYYFIFVSFILLLYLKYFVPV